MEVPEGYSAYLEHLEPEEIAERGARGVADERERAYLRSAENLSAWRASLGSVRSSSLDYEFAMREERLVERERPREQCPRVLCTRG